MSGTSEGAAAPNSAVGTLDHCRVAGWAWWNMGGSEEQAPSSYLPNCNLWSNKTHQHALDRESTCTSNYLLQSLLAPGSQTAWLLGGQYGTPGRRRDRARERERGKQIQQHVRGVGRDRYESRTATTKGYHLYCLFFAISRATLMSGASVRSGSASCMNGCSSTCLASGRFSASTSSVLAR